VVNAVVRNCVYVDRHTKRRQTLYEEVVDLECWRRRE